MPADRRASARALPVALAAALLLASASVGLAASPGTNPFTEAVVRFIVDNGKIESIVARTVPSTYVPSSIFYSFCQPPGDSETNTVTSGTFVVAADGKLTGTCEASRTITNSDGSTSVVKKHGMLTGTYDLAAQTVTFHFEGSTSSTFTPAANCAFNCAPTTAQMTMVADGPVGGAAVVGDTAEGTARHTFTCSATPACPIEKQVGTAGFRIQFLPALPTAPPGAGGATGGGPAGSDDGPDLPTALIFLILLALVLLGLGWLFRMRTRSYRTAGAINEAESRLAGMIGNDPVPSSASADAQAADDLNFLESSATWDAERAERTREATALKAASEEAGDASSAEAGIKEEAGKILDTLDVPGGGESSPEPSSTPTPGSPSETKREGGPLGAMVEQAMREHIHPSVGADRSGGFEDQTSYGKGADTAAPAASKAYEANVVASGSQASNDDPLTKDAEKQAQKDARDAEKDGDPEQEGR